jgi:N6-adenosine-specific RNA methylase IME4
MDPPICLDEERKPGQITLAEFEKINIPSLIKSGFLFIWAEKESIGKILKIAKKWGFRYVENFCWIKKNVNNTIAAQSSTYFKKSKATCLIFRNVF